MPLISALMVKRDYEHWNQPVFTYATPAEFMSRRSFVSGIHAITLAGGRVLDMLVNVRISSQAIVFFNAAVSREKSVLPVFSGLGVSAALPASVISISDPSLDDDDDLTLAWYAGSQKNALQKILPPLLDHLLRMLGCSRSILFGSSGGGFAAMVYARGLPNALPVAVNPQTRISRYFQPSVAAFARACYGWDGVQEIKTFLNGRVVERLSVLYRIGNTPFIYLQNKGDDHHVTEHALPFMAELGGARKPVSGRLGSGRMFFHHWGDGHAPLPRENVAELLSRAVFFEGPWSELVDILGTSRKGITGFMNELARQTEQDSLRK